MDEERNGGEHRAVQEILAARALRTLDEAELDAADTLLSRHLGSCAECRSAQVDFDAVAGELALAAPSIRPPGALEARVRRDVTDRGAPRRRGTVVAASAVVVALGLGMWSVHLTGRMSRAEHQQAQTAELMSAVAVPDSKVVQLAASARAGTSAQVAAVYVRGGGRLYVFGSMPDPRSDRVYQVWLGRAGLFASGGTFRPGPQGFVLVRLIADGAAYDHVLITEEDGNGSKHPSGELVAESDL
jgi:hypothetical protein